MNEDKKDKKYNIYTLIMEYAWLTIAISSIITALIDAKYHGINTEFTKFLIIGILSFSMYLFRRYKRKKDQTSNTPSKKI